MTFGITRLQQVFLVLAIACLTGGLFADGDSRVGILLSAGFMICLSLNLVCYVLGQDLKALAEKKGPGDKIG